MSRDRACDRCGTIGPIHSRRTGADLCQRCYRHPERTCGRCGRVGPIRKRATASTPDLCPACYLPPIAVCQRCSQEQPCRYVSTGTPTCERCILAEKMRALVTGPDGSIPIWAEPIERSLLSTKNPQTMRVWLQRSRGARVLKELVSGSLPLTHEALDSLEPNKAVEHLRGLLVASGALPWRDPLLARFELRTELRLRALHPDDRRLVVAFLRWRVMPRLRRSSAASVLRGTSIENAARLLNQTTRFLIWLRELDVSLEESNQIDIDRWLSEGKLTRFLIRDFVVWAARNGHMRLVTVPALAGSRRPATSSDDFARWSTARRLLTDDAIDAADRVAGILVVLYAQPVSRITRLTPKHVIVTESSVSLMLGPEPVEIPEPLAGLLRQLPERRRGGSSAYLSDPEQWLFPGGRAGHPISRSHLSKRLRDIGVGVRQARNGALLQLAGEVPPIVLADLLGISVNNAVKWVRLAAGDWSGYVTPAEVRNRASRSE